MMLVTLALDASTYIGSVAILVDGQVHAARDAAMRGEREERLLPAVEEALRDAGIGANRLGRIVCGAGPGSFTSLRIAASIAKGFAMALRVPLGTVSSLALMVASAAPRAGRYFAVLDAMRGDSYAALIEVGADGIVSAVSEAGLVRSELAAGEAERLDATPLGAGFAIAARPTAAALAGVAPTLIVQADLDSWEPQYGRLAEAQVKWEATHGRPLQTR